MSVGFRHSLLMPIAINHAALTTMQSTSRMQAWANYLDSLRDQAGASPTSESSRSLVPATSSQQLMLQLQAMEVLREIMLLNTDH